jgi:hypothetical protein
VQELLDERIIRRRENFPPEQFCRFSRVRQVKRAKRTLKRFKFFSEDKRILNAQIILPLHKNKCAKYLFMFDSKIPQEFREIEPDEYYRQKIELLKAEKSHVEGIEIVYLPEHWYPDEYYYTLEELDAMPISQQFCHEVEQSFLSRKAQIKGKLFANFLKSSLAPSLLGMPDTIKVATADENVLRGDVWGLKNIIFSIGPRTDEMDRVKVLVEEREKLNEDVNWISKKLKKRKTFDRCMKYIADNEINVNELEVKLRRIKAISQDPEVGKYSELIAVKKFVAKGDRKLKLDWELIETNNINDVYKTLTSESIGNVIIISHGKEDGFLVDSYGQEYPKAFFAELSPSLMSLNFYSCYSQDLVQLYDLKRKVSASPSFYKIRYLTSVSENNFFDSSSFAPVSAFSDYIRELDRYLDRSLKGAMAVQDEYGDELADYEQEEMCWLDVSDIRVEKGTYAVTLNGNYVGAFADHENYGDMFYPCRFLKTEKNSLKIKNIVNAGGSVIKNLKTFKLWIEDMELTPEYSRLRRNSYISFRF